MSSLAAFEPHRARSSRLARDAAARTAVLASSFSAPWPPQHEHRPLVASRDAQIVVQVHGSEPPRGSRNAQRKFKLLGGEPLGNADRARPELYVDRSWVLAVGTKVHVHRQ